MPSPADSSKRFQYTAPFDPDWAPGSGATDKSQVPAEKIAIDPFGPDRLPADNYRLLISAVTPRPIGFVSTVGVDGTENLAPFSYFSLMNHDPPIFAVGFSGGGERAKNSCKNLLETGECTINIISEWFIEAANYAAVNAPYGVSEWELTGLTRAAAQVVKAPHVAESAFSVEAKLEAHHQWHSEKTGAISGTTCILKGVHFHVSKSAVNDELNHIDIEKLRPVGRLGGVTYSRVLEGFEMPRPSYTEK